MKRVRWNLIQVLLVIYLLFSILFSRKIDANIYSYYINPLVLLIIAISAFIYTDNHHGRFVNYDDNKKTVIIATLLYIIIYFLSGLIFGYANTIYDHSIMGIIKNMYQYVFPIIFIEYIRSAIVNENKNNMLFLVLYTLVFILIEANFPRLIESFSDREESFQYISAFVLPTIFGNFLYTYLTLKGSYKLVLIYRLIIQITYLLVPIFPAHDWFVQGVFGILSPGVIYLSIKFQLNKKVLRDKKDIKKAKSKGYIPIVIIMSIFVLFMAGIFKYAPIAMLSNSMTPVYYKGDVLVYRKVTKEELKNIKKYNIIIYSKEGQYIAHRVMNIYQKNEKYYFITKGDANLQDDLDPVEEEQVIGLYKFHIKYIGYPSVWLNRFFRNEAAKVEIK